MVEFVKKKKPPLILFANRRTPTAIESKPKQ